MLILSREVNQGITVDLTEESLEALLAAARATGESQRIHILVTKFTSTGVRLGVDAPASVEVNRDEVQERIDAGITQE